MKCPNCGEDVKDTTKVCNHCGHVINQVHINKTQHPVKTAKKKRLPAWLKWSIVLISIILAFIIDLVMINLISSRRRLTQVQTMQTETALMSATEIIFLPTPTIEIIQPQLTSTEESIPQPTEEAPTQQVEATEEDFVNQEDDEMINSVDLEVVVAIPEGEFLMGAADYDNQADSNEKPRRTVFLDSYWIYKFEVTNSQYRDCIESGTCLGNVEDYTQDSYPVVSLTWHEAMNYCEWAGGRLPTEAEWEKAARGEGMNIYPWGNTSPNCILANYSGCVGGPDQVGSYPNGASPYGVLDMAGNVWEWVADWYDPDYYNQSGNTNNPLTSSYTGQKVIRGGSWGLGGNQLRVSFRGSFYPDDSYNNIGFRCVLDNPAE